MADDLLYRLWGKTNEREKGYTDGNWKYHPAICHMIDVGYVAETWLELSPSIVNRFFQLAPGIDPEQLKRIIVTITALHVLGKVHRSFQAKSEEEFSKWLTSLAQRHSSLSMGDDPLSVSSCLIRHAMSPQVRG